MSTVMIAAGPRMRRALPALIALLLISATLGLFALSSSQERSETHDATIGDALLARESIRFQLDREAEALQRIGADVGAGAVAPDALPARLRAFLRRAGQVDGLALVDASLASQARVQRVASRPDVVVQIPASAAAETMEAARASSRPTFTNAFQSDDGPTIALFVPVGDPTRERRFLVGVYSLRRLLEEMIPWNLAQDYAFTLSDVAGTVQAKRVSGGAGRNVYTHQEPLELPGTTLLLGLNSIKGPPDWIANALRAGIAALVALLLWSLWALKRAVERERVREERLQTAARLTTMGELASSLAHELNQPLGAIASYLAGSMNLLERGDPPRAELTAALAKASAQTQRAGEVIRRVHEFVRKQEPRRVPVDVAALLEDCRALVELQARRIGVRVEMKVEAGLPAIAGDPIMLEQVILNITRNAIDAMADVEPERRRLEIAAARDEGGLRVTVRDCGTGIAQEDSQKVFAPFYTTKAEGMGMGLSICRGIVEAHGGRLWFERLDPGVAFHLWLPAA